MTLLGLDQVVSPARPLAAGRGAPIRPSLREGSEDLTDLFSMGLLVVDETGKVLRANARARRILQGRQGLQIKDGCICATAPSVTASLRALLERAITSEEGARPGTTGMLLRNGADHFLLVARRIASRTGKPLVLLVVESRGSLADAGWIRDAFDLTPRQATLAALLARGHTVNESAHAMGISRNSVRTHLREIFMRLSLRNQTDLVRLLVGTALLMGES